MGAFGRGPASVSADVLPLKLPKDLSVWAFHDPDVRGVRQPVIADLPMIDRRRWASLTELIVIPVTLATPEPL
jgi:hypothetical protein